MTFPNKYQKMISITAVMTACFFWAISFIATKIATATVPPLTIVFLRLSISSLCFLIWFWVRRMRPKIVSFNLLGQLFLLSLFGSSLHYSSQTIGIVTTSASNASLFAVTAPLFITIISYFFLRERLTFQKSFGIFCALAGVLVVMGTDIFGASAEGGQVRGDLLVLSSLFMWAIFTVMGKSMMKQYGALELTALMTFIGALTMIPFGCGEMVFLGFNLNMIPIKAWLAIAFLGITCSFMATLLYMFALEKSDSQKVGVYLYTIPIMTYIFAGLFLGEEMTLNLFIGSFLVIGGVYITERS